MATETATGSLTQSTEKNLFIGFSDPSCSTTYDFEGYIDYAYIWGE